MFNLTPGNKKGNDGGSLATRNDFPLNRLRQEFETLFDQFFRGWPLLESDWPLQRGWGLDVDDNGKEIVVRAEAPGFEAGEFEVHLSGNLLTIQAEHKQEEEKREGETRYTERRLGRFQRTVSLPAGVEADKVDARYHNGVLEIRVPRSPEAQGRRIEVKT